MEEEIPTTESHYLWNLIIKIDVYVGLSPIKIKAIDVDYANKKTFMTPGN